MGPRLVSFFICECSSVPPSFVNGLGFVSCFRARVMVISPSPFFFFPRFVPSLFFPFCGLVAADAASRLKMDFMSRLDSGFPFFATFSRAETNDAMARERERKKSRKGVSLFWLCIHLWVSNIAETKNEEAEAEKPPFSGNHSKRRSSGKEKDSIYQTL